MRSTYIWEWLGIYVAATNRDEALDFIQHPRCDNADVDTEIYTLEDLAGRRDPGEHVRAEEYMRRLSPGEIVELEGYTNITMDDFIWPQLPTCRQKIHHRDAFVTLRMTVAALTELFADYRGIFYKEER